MSDKEIKNISHQNKLVVFQDKEIRRAWYNDEWYYSLVDIVAVLSESTNPTDYLKKIRKRDDELKNYIGTNCPHVEMQTTSGKNRKTLTSKVNLRDNMDDLELIFTMLGERVTTEISQEEKPETFQKSKKIAQRGGKVAGDARRSTEKELGRSVISNKNNLYVAHNKLELEDENIE